VPITKRSLAIAAAALAVIGLARARASTGGDQSASANGSVERATELLEGKRLTAYVNGSTTEATIDRSVDFCPGGHFVYESNSTFYQGAAFRQQRGRWRVVAANIRGDAGWAKVSWQASADAGTSRIVVNDRGVTIDGYPVQITSSSAC
jgi:hypothetical protein